MRLRRCWTHARYYYHDYDSSQYALLCPQVALFSHSLVIPLYISSLYFFGGVTLRVQGAGVLTEVAVRRDFSCHVPMRISSWVREWPTGGTKDDDGTHATWDHLAANRVALQGV